MPVQTTYPGVYIQERPSGARTLVGVSTSVTAFVGAAAKGPVDTPVRIFNYRDFERVFGPPISQDSPMAYAVQHFFANGGSEAVIVRAVAANANRANATLKNGTTNTAKDVLVMDAIGKGSWANDGAGKGVHAVVEKSKLNEKDLFNLLVRRLEIDPRTGAPVAVEEEAYANVSMAPKHPRYVLNLAGASNLVAARLPTQAPTTTAKGTSVSKDTVGSVAISPAKRSMRVSVDYGAPADVVLFPTETGTVTKTATEIKDELKLALQRANLAATADLDNGKLKIESNATGVDSAVTVMPATDGDITKDLTLGLAWGGEEVSSAATLRPTEADTGLTGGSDGGAVAARDVVPTSQVGGIYALRSLRVPRFNLLCLPDLTSANTNEINDALSFCRAERGFLLVDSPVAGFSTIPPNLGLAALGEHGAIYYPRLKLVERTDGGATRTLSLPASGAVAGVMARTDSARGIWKAPAGLEAGVVGATELTRPTDDNLSGQLNPRGINVLREFPGAGLVVWGARTLRGDDNLASEHKYIPVRRLTDYIATSLYLGTQFAVFEPNDPELWGQLRLAVTTFMRGLFRQGAFQQSSKRDEASSFFVICDETVNPQSEIDLGRVNVVVGFAPLKPAEFVVITITQISQLEE